MNETNRAVNRIVLLLVGLILLGAGASAALAASWAPAGQVWGDTLAGVQSWLSGADDETRLPGASAVSWLSLGGALVAVVIAVVAVTIIARLGGTTSAPVLHVADSDDDLGGIVVRPAFASDIVGQALAARDEILRTRITTARVRGQDVLHVDVIPRKRTSPAAIADLVTRATDALAAMTGRDLPVFISIRTGVRARVAAEQPRVS